MTALGRGLLAAAMVTLPFWLADPYYLHVVIMAGIFGVLALSLNLLLGYAGQLSLGHAAFFGIGAYTSALLTLKREWSFWPALAAAMVLAAVVSAAMAGLGGSLYAHYTRFVSPEVFLFTYTVTMVIMVVAGGKGTLAGPLVGAVLFTALPEALRLAASWQWQMLAYGLLLVLLVFFLPRGIVPQIVASFSGHPRSAPTSRTPLQ